MKTICLYFEIHQPAHVRRYRFFDIGTDHFYFDDFENERLMSDTAQRSYVPALDTLLEMSRASEGRFKVALSISGVGMEQLELYAPEVIERLQALNQTGCVEFLAEPYSHGLSSLVDGDAFQIEVKRQTEKIHDYFGQKPTILRNSSLIYSDEIGTMAASMGFKAMLTEGAKQVLGWKSPHYLYHNPLVPSLKLMLRDITMSDDISLRFSNPQWSGYPLFADKFAERIATLPEEEEIVNIFMNLSALGIAQPLSSNILDFFMALPAQAEKRGIKFATPSEIVKTHKSVAPLHVPDTISWLDEERDTSSLIGNNMQKEAFNKLYSVAERVRIANDSHLNQDWDYLQDTYHFRAMTTKPTHVGLDRGFYDSPYDAFTNYMNILGDFIWRTNSIYPSDIDNEELNSLLTTIRNQAKELAKKDREIARLKRKQDKHKE